VKALAALVCVAALTAAAASAQPVAGPVTGVKVSPSPFFSDEPLMRVTFRARRPAPAGYLYFVAWYTLARPSTPSAGCSLTSKIDALGHKGGFNVRVHVVLSPEPLFGDAFSPGRRSRQPRRVHCSAGLVERVGSDQTAVTRCRCPCRRLRGERLEGIPLLRVRLARELVIGQAPVPGEGIGLMFLLRALRGVQGMVLVTRIGGYPAAQLCPDSFKHGVWVLDL